MKGREVMAISVKYGRLNIDKVGEEEPVFIIRAQDRLAEPVIRMYQALAESHDLPIAGEIDRVLDDFRKWSGKRKIPD